MPSHGGRSFVQAGVDHECAAAALVLGDDDLASFRCEDARRGLVDVLEEDLLDAAGEHAYAVGLVSGRDAFGESGEEACGDSGEEGFHGGEAAWEEVEEAGGADEFL